MSALDMTLRLAGLSMSSVKHRAAEAYRFVLLPGETMRLPDGLRSIRVISGRAWLSHDGRDYDLRDGERVELRASEDFALVSEMRGESLFVEARSRR